MPLELQNLPVPTLDYISRELRPRYGAHGIDIQRVQMVGKAEMAALASDWALRLAYGRSPQALHIQAIINPWR